VEVRISDGNDDLEESQWDGSRNMDSTDLELGDAPEFFGYGAAPGGLNAFGFGFDPDFFGYQNVGLRFQGLQIPRGATITEAYIEFETDETNMMPTSVTFYGEASDNASAFSERYYDLSDRPQTNESVTWEIPAWNQVDEKHRSPDLRAIVQEVVNRSGWNPGGSMVFTIGGTGRRAAESYEGEAAAAPLLHITYTTGGSASVSE
jgi:hypothetical protein